ncbi:MAG: DeoR/GlpR family DNA-binding transcription regulator [Lapillicoccus sp.]
MKRAVGASRPTPATVRADTGRLHEPMSAGDLVGSATKPLRHERILAGLDAEGRVEVPVLASQLGVSEVTVRRDLLELEDSGRLRRVHGGAVSTFGRAFDRPYAVRHGAQSAAKAAIGAAAARLVNNGDAVALDVGSTVLALATHLRAGNLTLITANLRTAWEVSQSKTLSRPFRLIVSGGVVREDELSMTGDSALSHYRTMRADIAFLGVGGVSPEAGFTDFNLDDGELKRVLVRTARRVVVLADSTKLGAEYFVQVAELGQVDLLVTDRGADSQAVSRLRAAGLEIQLAD